MPVTPRTSSDSNAPPAPQRRLLLFHPSDLFFPTGTAMIYQRILPLLPDEWRVRHCFAWTPSPDLAELGERYRNALPRVTPMAFPRLRQMATFHRLFTRVTGKAPHAAMAWLVAGWLRRQVREFEPDLIWFSSDNLPFSHRLITRLLRTLRGKRVHLSLYDPLEFWNPSDRDRAIYQRAIGRADSFDVIGDHMRERIQHEAPDRPVWLLNDYVNDRPSVSTKPPTETRVVIAGSIYAAVELQHLLSYLGSAGREIVIEWFGDAHDRRHGADVTWPANVTLRAPGRVPRAEIGARIAGADFGYLAMPHDRPHFARYSLPTKLVTYAEAGLPVLFDAPADSEIETLNRRFCFGVNLATLPDPQTDLRNLLANASAFLPGIARLVAERFSRSHVEETLLAIMKAPRIEKD